MSAIEKKVIATAKVAIDIINELAGEHKGTEHASKALAAIEVIASALRAGFARGMSPDDVAKAIVAAREEMAATTATIADNNAIIDAEGNAKFPPGE